MDMRAGTGHSSGRRRGGAVLVGGRGMRVAVIGGGSIGQRHAGNLRALGAEAVLLPWRAFGGDPARFDAEGPFDAAVIATATQLREAPVALCAARGLPLYVEKPLAHDPATLDRIAELTRPLARRSMLGYMMRYHPAFRHLARLDLSDIYRARFEIGHDVRQWRQNWRFAKSYAARSEGGGVLLDLCHELDMALTLFPGLAIETVTSLGHDGFPGVDFSTEIAIAPGPAGGPAGTVSMDYLSPVSLRRIALRGTRHTVEFDLGSGQYLVAENGAWAQIPIAFERNRMFLDAMGDFLALVAGRAPSDVEHLPRLDLALGSAARVVEAYRARRFAGRIGGDFA